MLRLNLQGLRNGVHLDVRLKQVPARVVLMVIFGGVELGQRFELSHDLLLEDFLSIQIGNLGFGFFLLFVVREEDCRAVLPADVVLALFIQLSRIVSIEENIQQFVVRHLAGIVSDPDGFRVGSVPEMNSLVVGCGLRSTAIATLHIHDTRNLLERVLGTPEAPARENGDLILLGSRCVGRGGRLFRGIRRGSIWTNSGRFRAGTRRFRLSGKS